MEPNLITDSKLLDVFEELIKRETIFHRPEYGTTRRDFENMMETCFWEVGASGKRYSREYVLDTLEKRFKEGYEDKWEANDFHCLEISEDSFLITYTLIQESRITRRSTIWRRHNSQWKIVYHQGTVVDDE